MKIGVQTFSTFPNMKFIILAVIFIISCSQEDDKSVGHFNPNIAYGSFTDSRDNKNYRTVVIGTQTWMAENLNYDGPADSLIGMCIGEFGVIYPTLVDSGDGCSIYGRLYNWETAMTICPSGWRLPSVADWGQLLRYVDGTSGTVAIFNSSIAGEHLMAASGWPNCGPSGSGASYLCEDTYGFSALPGGIGDLESGSFGYVYGAGFWWLASESFIMFIIRGEAGFQLRSDGMLIYVRCIQD